MNNGQIFQKSNDNSRGLKYPQPVKILRQKCTFLSLGSDKIKVNHNNYEKDNQTNLNITNNGYVYNKKTLHHNSCKSYEPIRMMIENQVNSLNSMNNCNNIHSTEPLNSSTARYVNKNIPSSKVRNLKLHNIYNNLINEEENKEEKENKEDDDLDFDNDIYLSPLYTPFPGQSNSIHRSNFSLSPQATKVIFPLLPPKPLQNYKKKTLVLDLDETLVHSSFHKIEGISYDLVIKIFIFNTKKTIYVKLRPGLNKFLNKVSKFYELITFTASIPEYANQVINYFDRENLISYRFFRNDCTNMNGVYVKNLKKLNRDLKDLIIVDNSPMAYLLNKENGLPIKSWFDDMEDNELEYLGNLLEFLSLARDVRLVINNIVENNEINVDKANNFILECMENKEKRNFIFNEADDNNYDNNNDNDDNINKDNDIEINHKNANKNNIMDNNININDIFLGNFGGCDNDILLKINKDSNHCKNQKSNAITNNINENIIYNNNKINKNDIKNKNNKEYIKNINDNYKYKKENRKAKSTTSNYYNINNNFDLNKENYNNNNNCYCDENITKDSEFKENINFKVLERLENIINNKNKNYLKNKNLNKSSENISQKNKGNINKIINNNENCDNNILIIDNNETNNNNIINNVKTNINNNNLIINKEQSNNLNNISNNKTFRNDKINNCSEKTNYKFNDLGVNIMMKKKVKQNKHNNSYNTKININNCESTKANRQKISFNLMNSDNNIILDEISIPITKKSNYILNSKEVLNVDKGDGKLKKNNINAYNNKSYNTIKNNNNSNNNIVKNNLINLESIQDYNSLNNKINFNTKEPINYNSNNTNNIIINNNNIIINNNNNEYNNYRDFNDNYNTLSNNNNLKLYENILSNNQKINGLKSKKYISEIPIPLHYKKIKQKKGKTKIIECEYTESNTARNLENKNDSNTSRIRGSCFKSKIFNKENLNNNSNSSISYRENNSKFINILNEYNTYNNNRVGNKNNFNNISYLSYNNNINNNNNLNYNYINKSTNSNKHISNISNNISCNICNCNNTNRIYNNISNNISNYNSYANITTNTSHSNTNTISNANKSRKDNSAIMIKNDKLFKSQKQFSLSPYETFNSVNSINDTKLFSLKQLSIQNNNSKGISKIQKILNNKNEKIKEKISSLKTLSENNNIMNYNNKIRIDEYKKNPSFYKNIYSINTMNINDNTNKINGKLNSKIKRKINNSINNNSNINDIISNNINDIINNNNISNNINNNIFHNIYNSKENINNNNNFTMNFKLKNKINSMHKIKSDMHDINLDQDSILKQSKKVKGIKIQNFNLINKKHKSKSINDINLSDYSYSLREYLTSKSNTNKEITENNNSNINNKIIVNRKNKKNKENKLNKEDHNININNNRNNIKNKNCETLHQKNKSEFLNIQKLYNLKSDNYYICTGNSNYSNNMNTNTINKNFKKAKSKVKSMLNGFSIPIPNNIK